ncbi:G-protein coupled receptor Mth2-like [Pseudomyrmex gracilis]|uniref:G-protein coupled receptor Mth2-like n=1 Tax=Pseudomyrmex gracilis TaxID=219809 RepID=UPI0009951C2B|nr:G-protein coupled receptor Mth2-like [Pseudomyrmex gracilis]
MLSDVSCNRRLGTSSIRGCLWLLPCLWLIVNSVSSTNPSLNVSCCSENATWNHSINCSDGSRIRLSCPFGIFLIDPYAMENDNFTVVYEDDTAYLLSQLDERIPADKFCTTRSPKSGGEIALTCFDESSSSSTSVWKYTLVCIVSIISAIFLIATLAVYVILPELRELQDKAMMAAVTTMAVSYTVLSIQHLRPSMQDERTTCVTFGFILYFSFMSAFFWLNIVAFNVWRAVWFKNFRVREKSLFYAYCVWGWGVPACFLITSLTMHHVEGQHLKPGFGDYSCWFGGRLQTWVYFYGPVAVLLTLNIIYLGLTSWRLWHQYRDYTGSKLRVLRFKCLLYIKLVLVMGITWIFELLSFAVDTKIEEFWIPTDLINGLQGFIIFLLLVATRKRVRKLLAKKRPCGIVFPKSWAAYEDEECEAVLPEELELSQQG